MAQKTEGTDVIQIALPASLGYRKDMVGIPEAAPAGDGPHAVEAKTCGAGWASGTLESVISSDGIDLANGAPATVTGEDLIAEIAGISAETPLVNAVIAAKRTTAFGNNLKVAPPAQRQPIGACRKRVAAGAATGKGAGNEHALPA